MQTLQKLQLINSIVYMFGFFAWMYGVWQATKARRYYEEQSKRLEKFNTIMYEAIARYERVKNADASQ